MFCRNCGTKNDDNAYKCVECEHVLQKPHAAAPPVDIPNYLVQSILVTVFCCHWLGIPAIYFASQVNLQIAIGDYQAARESSRQARMWSWISFAVALLALLVYFGFLFIAFMLSARNAR